MKFKKRKIYLTIPNILLFVEEKQSQISENFSPMKETKVGLGFPTFYHFEEKTNLKLSLAFLERVMRSLS
jgi:hypothetical protein